MQLLQQKRTHQRQGHKIVDELYHHQTEHTQQTGSPSTGQSPYNGPYGSDIGNAPTPGATGAGPSTGILGNSSSSTDHTPDEIITEANEFVSQGTNSPMDGEKLKGHLLRYIIYYYRLEFFLSVAIGVYLGSQIYVIYCRG